jgi:hypothetical protein
MAIRFMYKALATAALGISLSLFLAAPTTAISDSSDMAGALQLDPPAPPSQCKAKTFYDRSEENTPYSVVVTWSDNSTNEYGFTIEEWWQYSSGEWVLTESVNRPANSTATTFYYLSRPTHSKYRVKAFNASGDSAWSNWAH